MVTSCIDSSAAIGNACDAGKRGRATRAAQEFEALLIGNLLRSMQKSFSTLLVQEEKPAGSDDYHYMATQAIASALAAGGGLGISRLILKDLAFHSQIH